MFLGSHTLRKLEQTDMNALHRPHRPIISIEIEEVIKTLKETTMTKKKNYTPQKFKAQIDSLQNSSWIFQELMLILLYLFNKIKKGRN